MERHTLETRAGSRGSLRGRCGENGGGGEPDGGPSHGGGPRKTASQGSHRDSPGAANPLPPNATAGRSLSPHRARSRLETGSRPRREPYIGLVAATTPNPFSDDPAVTARGLTRRFGCVLALDGIDLDLRWGRCLALVGPNGAGKSTALRLLCGLLRPDAGTVRVAGLDPVRDGRRLRETIGAVPDFPVLYDELTGRENLLAVARLRGIPRGEADRRIEELAAALRLQDSLDRPVAGCSRGERKKAALAAALLHAPPVLFLDEPFEGVDPLSARTIRELLGELRSRGAAVLVTSHVIPLVEAIASDVAILESGRLIAGGSLAEIAAAYGDLESAVLAAGGTAAAAPALPWYRVR
ncbi:MAG: ABC transporter ATP-binding protein [Acidobacteria bacterium]|nr:MAG: ABC transporter ATP-binding protein [Acidobacteriota bacterium]